MERATIDLQARRQALARSGSVSARNWTQAQNAFVPRQQLASAVAAQAQARANREAAIGASRSTPP